MQLSREEIEVSLSLSACSGWDREFLASVLSQMERGRNLSSRQQEVLKDVLGRNRPADQVAHDNWIAEYLAAHQDRARVVATYYSRSPYYVAMANEILAGKVPDRRAFARMMDNKYAAKVLAEDARIPRYSMADHIAPRAGFDSRHAEFDSALPWGTQKDTLAKFQKNGGFIIEVRKEIYSAAKNVKRYKILPIGSSLPFIIEERYLKIKRK